MRISSKPKESAGHLLLLENRFGVGLGGSYPLILEKKKKLGKHAVLNHKKLIEIEPFFDVERLGVEYSPKWKFSLWKIPSWRKGFRHQRSTINEDY